MTYPPSVRVVEVGPRDGLQNEEAPLPTGAKVRFVRDLRDAGLASIEATSFVRPDRIPQLADAEDVMGALRGVPGLVCLVPNKRGLARALAAGASEIAVFAAASETFSRRNVNASIDECLASIRPVLDEARARGVRARGYVSTAFGCPYEGAVPEEALARVMDALLGWGVFECSLGDTTAMADPLQVERVLAGLASRFGLSRVALHFHDTRGLALANVLAALKAGVAAFDSSAGGLGGCPYAEGAGGNVATEDLVTMLGSMGIATGVDAAKVALAAAPVLARLGKESPSKMHRLLRAAARPAPPRGPARGGR